MGKVVLRMCKAGEVSRAKIKLVCKLKNSGRVFVRGTCGYAHTTVPFVGLFFSYADDFCCVVVRSSVKEIVPFLSDVCERVSVNDFLSICSTP